MSDYSLATPFSNNLYNNAFLSVTARKPGETAKTAPIPLAFKNATLPTASNNPTADQANLNAATTGTNQDFTHGALNDVGLATFSTQKPGPSPTAPNAGGQGTEQKSFGSRLMANLADNKNSFGLIGALIGALGGDGSDKDAPAEKPAAPAAGQIGTLTRKADDLKVVDEDPNKPSKPVEAGTVSMNTVDGTPEQPQGTSAGSGNVSFGNNPPPAGDKDSHDAETTSPDANASRNGDGRIDPGQAARIQEQLDALNGTPEQQKAFLEANGHGDKSAARETPATGNTPTAAQKPAAVTPTAGQSNPNAGTLSPSQNDAIAQKELTKNVDGMTPDERKEYFANRNARYAQEDGDGKEDGTSPSKPNTPTAQQAAAANDKIAQGSAARDHADGITGHNPNDPNSGSSDGGLFGS